MMSETALSRSAFYRPDPLEWQDIQAWLFAPLLPWQQDKWQYFTTHFPNLPHAILFAGSAGTGKRAFTYRLVAWLLCENQNEQLGDYPEPKVACGHCPSCQWLKANHHPNLLTIPSIAGREPDDSKEKPVKAAKKNTLIDTSPTHHSNASIKIDDIRAMTDFVQTSSDGVRIVVVHQAESMTLGAANALLKTLEEPPEKVLIFLLSDTPSRLLPTIRSRLQSVNISQITAEQSLHFMQNQLGTTTYSAQALNQVNAISGFAPLVALDMLTSLWYSQRQVWLNSWQAIRAGQRTPVQASDFWQKQLSLSDFLFLSQLMLADIISLSVKLPTQQTDIDWQKLQPLPHILALYGLQQTIAQIEQDRRQNIQEKLCYDKLLGQMAQI